MNLRMEIFRLSREKGYTTGYGVKLFLPTGHQQAVAHCFPSNRPPTSCYSLFSFEQATNKLLLIVFLWTGHQQAVTHCFPLNRPPTSCYSLFSFEQATNKLLLIVFLPTCHQQAVAHCFPSNRPPPSCCSLLFFQQATNKLLFIGRCSKLSFTSISWDIPHTWNTH